MGTGAPTPGGPTPRAGDSLKRLLVVAVDFPPQGGVGAIRAAKFVKYLGEFGWQPVVITSDVRWYVDESLTRDVPAGVEVHAVRWPAVVRALRPPVRPSGETAEATGGSRSGRTVAAKRALARLARRLFVPDVAVLWVPAARKASARAIREHRCHAVFTTSPPQSVHLVGEWVRGRFGLPWVADYRDLWTAAGPFPEHASPLRLVLHRSIERRMLERCDRIVTVTTRQGERVRDAFGDHLAAKLVTVPNGFDPADFEHVAGNARPPGPLRLTYTGGLTGARAHGARPFFEALRSLAAAGVGRQALDVRLVGAFDPAIYSWAEPLVQQGIVRLCPFSAHLDAVSEMAAADVLLLISTDDEEGRVAAPSKLYEYLALGRPILALAPEGETTAVVGQAGLGVCVRPSDADAIRRAIDRFLAMHARGELPRVSPATADLRQFQRRELARRLAACLDEMTA